jgi:hypothetical protein
MNNVQLNLLDIPVQVYDITVQQRQATEPRPLAMSHVMNRNMSHRVHQHMHDMQDGVGIAKECAGVCCGSLKRDNNENMKNDFIENKELIFGTMKQDKIVFNLDEESKSKIQRAPRSKNIGGLSCISYHATVLNLFVEWLSGEQFPESVNAKRGRCMYLGLVFRRAVLQNKEGIFWVPPQLYHIFQEDEHRKDIIKRLK